MPQPQHREADRGEVSEHVWTDAEVAFAWKAITTNGYYSSILRALYVGGKDDDSRFRKKVRRKKKDVVVSTECDAVPIPPS